jgi:hypothetical protein
MNISKVFSAYCGKITGELNTITCAADVAGSLAGHSFKFYLKDYLGVERAFQPYFIVSGVGVSPVVGIFRPIPVHITLNDAANTVAQALRAALKAYTGIFNDARVAGVDPDVTITCRWPYNTTNMADVDLGTFTFVTTTAGSTTVAYNIGLAAAAGSYVWQPPPLTWAKTYLRKAIISISDAAVTTPTNFGDIAALANGVALQVRDHDGVALTPFLPSAIKDNGSLINLGRATILGAVYYTVEIDFVEAFGGELPVDGNLCQDFNFSVNDNLTGLTTLYCAVFGHFSPTVN